MSLHFAEYILDRLWDFAILTRFVVFDASESRVPTERGRVLHREVLRRGDTMETAIVLGKALDVYRIIFKSGKKLIFGGLPRVDIRDNTSANWIDDKALLKERLAREKIPVSAGKSFSSLKEAEIYFSLQNHPVIVKPRFGSRGRHTTTFITRPDDFRNAFKVAKQLGYYVVVEEHLIGSVYRATMVDGVLAGVLAGDPPRVTGDAEHTIAELIVLKNRNRHERVSAYSPTETTRIFLDRQGYTLDTILDRGVTVDLTEKIGLSYGGNAREVTPYVHPELRAELERAAKIVDDPIIGFDFITQDVTKAPNTVRWGIIECNALPFINLHHDPLEGEPVNVAGIFLDYIERKLQLR